jgi:DNA-binding NarL/FixJ family response regulator
LFPGDGARSEPPTAASELPTLVPKSGVPTAANPLPLLAAGNDETRVAVEAVARVEARERAALDPHDVVVQSLVGIGMHLAHMADASADAGLADALARAIRAVSSGESLLDPALTRAVLDHVRSGAAQATHDQRLARLSRQEGRVLELIAEGMTNRQIGEQLGLSSKTVKNYVSAILVKLDVLRRAEAAAYFAARRAVATP